MQVSIIMITYNRGEFIKQAIDSVLSQTFFDWELLVIDDGSTDNTKQVLSEFKDERVKYLVNEANLGIAKSRNKGLELATGKYIAVLDSDDLWCDKEKLTKQVEYLEKNENVALIGTSAKTVNENGSETGAIMNPESEELIRSRILWKNPFVHSSVVFRKTSAMEAGGYDESLKVGEDYKLWLEIGKKHSFANLPGQMVAYRTHGKNTVSRNTETALLNNIRIINEFKTFYPNYFIALMRRRIRYEAFLARKRFL